MRTAKARRTQLLSTYGVGALFPAETTSFMVAGLHLWNVDNTDTIVEPRLARLLRIREFKAPPAGGRRDIPVIRYPYTQVCPKCRRIGSLKELSNDPSTATCKEDGTDLSPFRLITVCRNGHIDEFPVFRWLHDGQRAKIKADRHEMRLLVAGRTSSLGDLTLTCTCGVDPRDLEDAVGGRALASFGKCRGMRPWLGLDTTENCDEVPQAVQRGASNVWFPAVRSALSIPPYSEALARFVDRFWQALEDPAKVTPEVISFVSTMSNGRYTADQIRREVDRRHGEEHDGGEVSESSLRRDEYRALIEGREEDELGSDFVCLKREVPEEFEALITDVRKVTRLREVRALEGFTRLEGVPDPSETKKLCQLSATSLSWLPAIEVIGEGVFLGFDRKALDEWASGALATRQRQLLQSAENRAAEEYKRLPRVVDIVKVAIHTLAHVLIDQFSLDAGYPAASLRERLFVDENMAGLLVYTASSDSAGSLGGVASMAEPDRLHAALTEGLQRLSWCSSDPVCIESRGSGSDGLNLAACHACVLAPETSCEMSNTFLDRTLLFGTHEDGLEAGGLFSEFVGRVYG